MFCLKFSCQKFKPENYNSIMPSWETLYKEKGIIQKEPSEFVKEAVRFFMRQKRAAAYLLYAKK